MSSVSYATVFFLIGYDIMVHIRINIMVQQFVNLGHELLTYWMQCMSRPPKQTRSGLDLQPLTALQRPQSLPIFTAAFKPE